MDATPKVCPRCGSVHYANATGERPCVPHTYPRMGLVLIALFLASVALYTGVAVARWLM